MILGLGNDILTDDGIGVKLVRELQKVIHQAHIAFHTCALGGLEILELISDFDRVIIVDAIMTRDGIPGTIVHLTPANYQETLHLSNYHDVSFLVLLEFAKQIEIPKPEQIDILAIEIVEDLSFSSDFSPQIALKYEKIYGQVLEMVRTLILGD